VGGEREREREREKEILLLLLLLLLLLHTFIPSLREVRTTVLLLYGTEGSCPRLTHP